MTDHRKNFIKGHVRSTDRKRVQRISKNFDKLTEQELEQLSDVTGSDGVSTDDIFERLCAWGWFNEVAVSMFRKLYK